MKKIFLTLTVILISVSVFAQQPKPSVTTTPKRMTGHYWFMANIDTTTGVYADTMGLYILHDTAFIWNNKGHLMTDTLVWKDGTKTYSAGTSSFTTIIIKTDTILGYNPLSDSCVAYFKVKHVASCSPLILSSPDSVCTYGDLRQKDGSVAFRGTSGDNPFHNDGTLFMWYGAKSALRAGTANNNEWLTDSIGQNSFGFGNQIKAIGDNSFAAGTQLRVSADAGAAFGTGNKNYGNSSLIFGNSNINYTTGAQSIVGGSGNYNYGQYSAVFGNNNINSATYSLVGGNTSYVRGTAESSLVFGNNLIGNKQYQSVLGTYNDTTTSALFVVGNGDAATLSNALEVYADSVVKTPGKFVQYKPDHAFGYYADNTGYPVQIDVQNAWMDMTDSTAVRTTGVEIMGFQNDNDTLIFNGYTSAHLFFNFTASVAGTNAQDFEMRVFNITDNAEVPGTDMFTTTGATNRTNVTVLAYDKNANKGDRYIVQVRNLSAAADLQVFRYMAKINVEHYK